MAAILPTVPVEMPDLAGQAFKLQEYRAEQKAATAAQQEKARSARSASIGLDKLYGQQAETGLILNRFKPEVQKAFDEAVRAGQQFEYTGLDSDKQAYLENMGGFNMLLGGAKFHTKNFIDTRNSYIKDPSAFAISGDQFMNLASDYANTKAPVEEIIDVNQIFALPATEEIKFQTPEEMASMGMKLMDNLKDTFSPDGVSFNKTGFLDYASTKWLPTMFPANSNAELKAVLYGAQALGEGGLGLNRNPSQQDIQKYAALPQDAKDRLKQVYYNDVMRQLTANTPTKIGQPKQEGEDANIDRRSKNYMGLTPINEPIADAKYTPPAKTKGGKTVGQAEMKEGKSRDVSMYELPGNLFIKTGLYEITAFGQGEDGTQFVRKRRRREDGTYEIVVDRASKTDLAILLNKMGPDAYYEYLDF
jgi:hypothetical protein